MSGGREVIQATAVEPTNRTSDLSSTRTDTQIRSRTHALEVREHIHTRTQADKEAGAQSHAA